MPYRSKSGSPHSPFPIVSRPDVIVVLEKIYLPYSLAGAFWIVLKKIVSFNNMHGYRSLHFLLRLIVGIMDHSSLHGTENCLDDIQELRACWERDELDSRARAFHTVPSVKFVGPLHQLVRPVP